MRRACSLVGSVCLALGCAGLLAPAVAQPPDILHSFRLIPLKSTLEKTGGFAGVHVNFHLFGKFDIITGYEQGPLAVFPPILTPYAQFDNVDIAAVPRHPDIDPVRIPLERFIDLEELRGTFRPDRPRRLIFKGFDQQHQPFEMLAVQRGRLLHLLGASREQCCDFFQYKIDALAHIAPYADFNLDGMVDRADVNRLLANIGMAAEATLEEGDADGDGDVDGNDFLHWQQQVGTSVDMSEFAADSLDDTALATAVVPEPTTLGLCLSLVMLSAVCRRRLHRE